MGKKKAVLIGCNYPNTAAELKGCINDVNRIHRCLIDRFGFLDSDITVLIDTDPSYIQPTGTNVRQAITDLVRSAEPGDYLFLHYSGHGTRLLAEDDETGYDECIVPCDMNLITDLITDDEFRNFVNEMPNGCQITIVSDSCHSGGLIDKTKEQIGESTKHKYEKSSCWEFCLSFLKQAFEGAVNSREVHLSHEIHLQCPEVDIKNRHLPLSVLIEMLKQKTGNEKIELGKIRPTLFSIFGNDASPKIKKFMKSLQKKLQYYGMSESSSGGFMGMVGNIAQFLNLNLEEYNEDYLKSALETKVDSEPEIHAAANNMSFTHNGILISACQTDQKSADAYPPGGEAYGALSNVIQIILNESDCAISNYDLVMKARAMLAKQGFSQEPGLYCSDDHVDAPFLCP